MKVIHEYTGELIDIRNAVKVYVCKFNRGYAIGYVLRGQTIDANVLMEDGNFCEMPIYAPLYEKNKFYSNFYGITLVYLGSRKDLVNRYKYTKGFGRFPYSFNRNYEAIDNFNVFDGRQELDETKNIGELLNYTFGLEFETNKGYIPENDCFKNGLIPLRDGSISGLEYSTIVLNKSEGINLLKKALGDLVKYTSYDWNCSLHMHLGGFPLDEKKIWKLYKYLYKFQFMIQPYISDYAFHTKEFKNNGKDYCKPLPLYRNFKSMYKSIANTYFFGDFYQAHPNDIEHHAKWRIPSRYYFCNLVNLLCYDKNKTVEFRFLHPTFNYNRIIWWMLTFNALLYNAEIGKDLKDIQCIEDLFKIYPRNIQKQMKLGLEDLLELKRLQLKNDDKFDIDNSHEYQVFSNLNFDL